MQHVDNGAPHVASAESDQRTDRQVPPLRRRDRVAMGLRPHTMLVIVGGFVLLGVCLLLGGAAGATRASGLPAVALVFVPIWLAAAGVNTWLGLRRAAYSVTDEVRGFVVVFGVPATAAVLAWWRLRSR